MSTAHPRGQQRRRGFSFLEMLVVLVILSVVMGAVFQQISDAQRRAAVEQSRTDMFQESREFMDQCVRDLHEAGYPNSHNYGPGMLTSYDDANNAVGLVKVDAGHIWFEGDVDSDGIVDSVQYRLDSSGDHCPCLRRSQIAKVTGNPYTGQGTATFQTEVQNVQNGAAGDPIFRAFLADGTAVTLPVDITSDAATLASIKTIEVVLGVQTASPDPQSGRNLQTVLRYVIRLNNCSQAVHGRPMSCQ